MYHNLQAVKMKAKHHLFKLDIFPVLVTINPDKVQLLFKNFL